MGALPFSPLLLHTPSPDRAFLQQNKVFYEKASCGEAPPPSWPPSDPVPVVLVREGVLCFRC